MIRKVIIVALAFAVIGIVFKNVFSRSTHQIWKIGTKRAVAINMSFQVMELTYFTVASSTTTDIYKTWPGCRFMRIRIHNLSNKSSSRIAYTVWFPTWIIFLIATYPTIAFIRGPLRRWRRWRRRRKGLCLKCGYNLTGNESGVCPECGVPT